MACAGGKKERCVDLDRGVEMRKTKSGVEVYQYIDEPGVYRSAFNDEVPEELARSAGYPVEDRAKNRKLKERMAQFEAQLRKELEISEADGTRTVVEVRGSYKIVDIGLGRYKIEDDEGNQMHKDPLSQAVAYKLLDQLVPKAPEPTVEE